LSPAVNGAPSLLVLQEHVRQSSRPFFGNQDPSQSYCAAGC
jgi:hypothetical protein